MNPSKPERYLGLDALRGIAALVVVLYHFQTSSPLTSNFFVARGTLMVDFFFVLSGFVISLNYNERVRTVSDLWWFQKKRFWRLYPLHFATFLAFVGIEAFQADHNPAAAFVGDNLEAALHNLFLTQAVLMDRPSFNMPAWSISSEFWTYLVFGVVMLCGRFRWPLLFAIWLIAGIHCLSAPMTFGSLLSRTVYGFALGVMVHQIQSRQKNRYFGSMVPVLAMAVAVWAMGEGPIEKGTVYLFLYVPLAFAVVVYTVAQAGPETILQRVLTSPVPAFLGKISYSIYMTHAILTFWFFYFILKRPPPDPFEATMITFLLIACVVALSTITYTLFEQPFWLTESRDARDSRTVGTAVGVDVHH